MVVELLLIDSFTVSLLLLALFGLLNTFEYPHSFVYECLINDDDICNAKTNLCPPPHTHPYPFNFDLCQICDFFYLSAS